MSAELPAAVRSGVAPVRDAAALICGTFTGEAGIFPASPAAN